LLGVSAKHFNDDVSTTVSQKATTGSATFISVKKLILKVYKYIKCSIKKYNVGYIYQFQSTFFLNRALHNPSIIRQFQV